ncbi:Vacuolar protein sorting protein vps66 [Coemansia interrupta]|uniref:Vacuolar protein sorting protein vps66 n=1 Tax=Coemansia interrupta TaxID=1126814 RepID=A0A9W8HNV9_9FUNG|nr:Vacuolar protein sorting protein vps66 [Coemansia interrupta]
MEKYSKWRDAGTGIQPFLQPVPARAEQEGLSGLLNRAKSYILGPIVATVRLAVLGVTAALDAAFSALTPLLIVPSVRRAYQRSTRSLLARLALLAMGFYTFDTKTTSLQKGRRTAAGAAKKARGVCSGDLIIANHVSYVDVLYLVARYNPVFVEIDNATMHARTLSLWSALRAPSQPTPALLPASEARPLKSITQEARLKSLGPVVVFPENATSNGRALLQLLPVFEEVENQDEKSEMHLVAFRYPFRFFSPAYSVGSQMRHLFGLCCQVYNSAAVKVLEPAEAPRVATSAMFCEAGEEPVDLDEAVKEKLMQLSRLRQTKLTAMDKRDFLAFYYKRTKSGYRDQI